MLFDAPKLEEWCHLQFSHNTTFMFSAFVINFSSSFFCFCMDRTQTSPKQLSEQDKEGKM